MLTITPVMWLILLINITNTLKISETYVLGAVVAVIVW
jgi:hypothetical protein